jgi:hypothetical protein
MDNREVETARWSDAPVVTASAETNADVDREAKATRSMLRGLLWLGLIALAFSLARAGLQRAFFPHWWARW